MKKALLIKILLVFVVLATIAAYRLNDDASKSKLLMEAVSQMLLRNHYNPVDIDDEFSKQAFKLYIERLDYNKRFLVKPDIQQLEAYKLKLDDDIKAGNYEFFELSVQLLNKRIGKAETLYKDILESPFDFEKDEEMEFDEEKLDFADDEDTLKERWRKYLKYQTLVKLQNLIEEQEKAIEKKDTSVTEKSFEELEIEAREKVLKNQDDWFHRISKLEKSDRRNLYLNAITNCFDPHTGYFPPKDKEDFDISMSGQLEGIGATLQSQNDGYIKVVRIVVGSASWRQGDLEVGDLITKVAQADEEPVNVVDMRLDKAVRLIRGPKGTEVRLTVKKRDGSMQVIPIIRDIVVLEETFAKSLVLKDEKEKKKIGYIYLPKFYLQMNGGGSGHVCSDDVKKEVKKLKDEGIDGIILDLRNNGGGSLQDVVKIAGLFIEEGPIVQIKTRPNPAHVLEDKDPKIQYKGPLVVMVNSFSASASEIFAAAIQDYNRGVIIGSNSTYGKGTVQRFIDFDDYLSNEFSQYKPLGSIKMTIQKFYRINGGTTQLKGVIPDIILPDNYSYLEIGERELDNALQWDEIKPAKYYKWHKKYDLEKIQKQSKKRLEKNATFQLIDENAKRLKKQRDETIFTLNYEKYKQEELEQKEEAKKYESIQKDPTGLHIASLNIDLPIVERDSITIEKRKKWIQGLEKDAYLFEAFSVISDIEE